MRIDPGGIARRVEPQSRTKLAIQQQQRLVGKLHDAQRGPPGKPMCRRDHCHDVDGIEELAAHAGAAGRHNRQVDVAVVKLSVLICAAAFKQADFDARMTPQIAHQEWGKKILDHLWGGADAQRSHLPAFKSTRPLADQVGIRQQAATAPEQVLSRRCQPDAPADAIEELQVQFVLQRADLPRRRRLRQVQPLGGAREPAVVDDGNESAQVAELHPKAFPNFIKDDAANELDTSRMNSLWLSAIFGRPRSGAAANYQSREYPEGDEFMNRIPIAVGLFAMSAAGLSFSSFIPAKGFASTAAEIQVMSADVLRPALINLVAEFERSTKHKVTIIFATTGVVRNSVQAGEVGDVAIMQRPAINELAQQGEIVAGSIVDLGHSAVGVGVRAGAPKPDITSVDGFKRALLAAKSIGYTDPKKGGGSGVYFALLLERLGVAEAVKSKTKYPRTGQSATELIAEGEVDFGIAQPMEILAKPEIELVGVLPSELQDPKLFVFSAGVLQGAKEPEAARALIQFLSGPAAAAVIKANGIDPG